MNGVDYQPQTASPNKKHAKAMAATVALQALGEVTFSINEATSSNEAKDMSGLMHVPEGFTKHR